MYSMRRERVFPLHHRCWWVCWLSHRRPYPGGGLDAILSSSMSVTLLNTMSRCIGLSTRNAIRIYCCTPVDVVTYYPLRIHDCFIELSNICSASRCHSFSLGLTSAIYNTSLWLLIVAGLNTGVCGIVKLSCEHLYHNALCPRVSSFVDPYKSKMFLDTAVLFQDHSLMSLSESGFSSRDNRVFPFNLENFRSGRSSVELPWMGIKMTTKIGSFRSDHLWIAGHECLWTQ